MALRHLGGPVAGGESEQGPGAAPHAWILRANEHAFEERSLHRREVQRHGVTRLLRARACRVGTSGD